MKSKYVVFCHLKAPLCPPCPLLGLSVGLCTRQTLKWFDHSKAILQFQLFICLFVCLIFLKIYMLNVADGEIFNLLGLFPVGLFFLLFSTILHFRRNCL
jgi:hypothetical protein